MKRDFTVVYTPIEDGWVRATVPELPGAVTQGKDLDEARVLIKEAIVLLLASAREQAAQQAMKDTVWETVTVDVPDE